MLQLALTGLLLQHPPLALLLEHSVQSALQPSNARYCRCQLLADPLSRQRMAAAWAALDWLPQLVPLPVPGAASGGELEGVAPMNTLLREVLFARVSAAAAPAHAPAGRAACTAGPHAASEQQCTALLNMHQLCCGVLLPVAAAAALEPRGAGRQLARRAPPRCAAARLWAAAESALRAACRGEGLGELPCALLAWMFLGTCWLASQAAAGPAPSTAS